MGRKKRTTPMVRLNHFLRADQVERLETMAVRTGLDRSALIRQFIDEGLEREERRKNKREER